MTTPPTFLGPLRDDLIRGAGTHRQRRRHRTGVLITVVVLAVVVGSILVLGRHNDATKVVTTDPPTTSDPLTGRELTGHLLDGRPWTLRTIDDGRYCVRFAEIDLGCDTDVDDPNPAEPRGAAHPAEPGNPPYPESEASALLYAVLPADATGVRFTHEDGHEARSVVTIDPATGIWAAAVVEGDNPDRVIYVDQAGDTVATYRLGQLSARTTTTAP